jgi:hypothetical protein
MSHPKTQNWTAVETTGDFAGGDRKITVRGQVEVGNAADRASLSEREPITGYLPLNLVITPGTGPTVMTWTIAEFARPLADQEHFAEVKIFSGGDEIETVPVEIIPSVANA